MKKVTIGVDIGGSHVLSMGVDTASGAILEKTRVHTKIDSKASSNQIFDDWARAINATIERIDDQDITGVGFAMPGPFNYAQGVARFKGNDKYESIYGLTVEDHLKSRLSIPDLPMRFHNDASCFAIGEDGFGAARGHQRSICVTLGTGFGSSFIDDGIPIVVREDVPEDGCLWHLAFKEGIADEYFSTRGFVRAYQEKFGDTLPGVKEIVQKRESDPSVQAIFDNFGRDMITFMAPWIEKFQPSVIVLGGNISGAYSLFSPSLDREMEARGFTTEIKTSDLKEDAAILGGARLMDDSYFEKIKEFLPTK